MRLDTGVEAQIAETMGYLDKTYPDWGMYEDEMTRLVIKHPSLRNDPDLLYKMGKGEAMGTLRAAAKRRVKLSKKASKTVKTGERPTKPAVTTSKGKKLTFLEAWDRAKRDATTSAP
jgi:hypothetical protein